MAEEKKGKGKAPRAPFEAKELHACGSFQKNPREQIHVKIMDYNGRAFLDIRTYWKQGEEGQWRPSSKGCTVPIDQFDDFDAAYKRAVEWVKRDAGAAPDPHQKTEDVGF